MFVHRLVLLAFKGPRPDGQYCRHLNGVPTDNRLANLAWGTKSENTFDKVGHGTHPHASKTTLSLIEIRGMALVARQLDGVVFEGALADANLVLRQGNWAEQPIPFCEKPFVHVLRLEAFGRADIGRRGWGAGPPAASIVGHVNSFPREDNPFFRNRARLADSLSAAHRRQFRSPFART